MSSQTQKTCFVVCALGEADSHTRKHSDKVYKYLIEPVCREEDFEVFRSDKITANDRIDETIISHLKNDDLIIIDMSQHNPNVFYEFGFRHATGKPFIPIRTKSSDKIPFDVSTLRTIEYTTEVDDIDSAKRQLRETIRSIAFDANEDSLSEKDYSEISNSLFNIHAKLDKLIDSNKPNEEDNIFNDPFSNQRTFMDIAEDDLPF